MVGVYVRVSTVGQNEAGQRREIQRWLDGNGIPADQVRWYTDVESRDHLNRAGFKRLQKDVFDGTVRTVVVYKLDRISGSLRDGVVTLSDWLDRGVRFVAVTQQFDFSGTIGQMVAALLFGISQMEQETRRERQAAGIAVAKERGIYTGRKPGSTKASAQRVIELRRKGMTVNEVAAACNVSRRTVLRYCSTIQFLGMPGSLAEAPSRERSSTIQRFAPQIPST